MKQQNNRQQIGRPWPKGKSGNPAGRPRGSVSLSTTLRKTMTRTDAQAICKRLILSAKRGSLQATKLIFEKLDGADIETRLAALEQKLFPSQNDQQHTP